MVTEKSPNRFAANDCYVGPRHRTASSVSRDSLVHAVPDVRFRTSAPARFRGPVRCRTSSLDLPTARLNMSWLVLSNRRSGSSVRDRSIWSLATAAPPPASRPPIPTDLQECYE